MGYSNTFFDCSCDANACVAVEQILGSEGPCQNDLHFKQNNLLLVAMQLLLAMHLLLLAKESTKQNNSEKEFSQTPRFDPVPHLFQALMRIAFQLLVLNPENVHFLRLMWLICLSDSNVSRFTSLVSHAVTMNTRAASNRW